MEHDVATVHTDSDCAGCRSTRRSSSRGVLMVGDQLVKTWSRTQAALALSSAEAELAAAATGAAGYVGLIPLLRDLGRECWR